MKLLEGLVANIDQNTNAGQYCNIVIDLNERTLSYPFGALSFNSESDKKSFREFLDNDKSHLHLFRLWYLIGEYVTNKQLPEKQKLY